MIFSGRLFFEDTKHAPFELLHFLPSGLCLDLGAAAGIYTRLIRRRNPDCRVIAFEPFAGNHPHFRRNVPPDPKVTLYEAAVGEKTTKVNFFVPSTVKGSENGWQKYTGYSSLGHIVSSDDANHARSMEVDCYALDDLIKERVRFCKMDIQGGEKAALRGARGLLADQKIDIFLIEFDGDIEILNLLAASGYVFVDSKYLLVCSRNTPSSEHWGALEAIKLSTGVQAFNGWPTGAPTESAAYCQWLRDQSRQIGGVWTDLVCVRIGFLPEFLEAAAQLRRRLDTSCGQPSPSTV
jgi:FkbM family methyltransferase